MREIKFRAWTDKGEMIYNYCQLIGNRFFGEDMTNTNYGNVVDIMQFTGLYDCDGKEIYEGDIIVIHNLTYEIVFVNGEFCGKALNISNPVSRCDAGNFQYCEIIGNIHEAQ